MAQAAQDMLGARKAPDLSTALRQLAEAEISERQVRSVTYQMRMARFPHPKDFATFDHGVCACDRAQLDTLCTGQFTQEAQNIILVGGSGPAS